MTLVLKVTLDHLDHNPVLVPRAPLLVRKVYLATKAIREILEKLDHAVSLDNLDDLDHPAHLEPEEKKAYPGLLDLEAKKAGLVYLDHLVIKVIEVQTDYLDILAAPVPKVTGVCLVAMVQRVCLDHLDHLVELMFKMDLLAHLVRRDAQEHQVLLEAMDSPGQWDHLDRKDQSVALAPLDYLVVKDLLVPLV